MSGTRLFISTLLFVVGAALADEVNFKLVTIDQGPVKGYKSSTGNLFVFYGVPYATAPTGLHKFKGPLPAPTWTKTFEAVNKEIHCPQAASPMNIGESKQEQKQDNCLIANIYVPDTNETDLPVVVNVHGGGYQVGSGNFLTPYALVNEGQLIYVNFNYRLGIIGFLCLGTEDVPGNAGMKDQVALLRWVKKNIARFGGNPNDVTIGGYSAGSSAVELLTLSEMTKELFNKVIPESGAAVATWSVQIDPIENAKSYARRFNITSNNVQDVEMFYKNSSVAELTMDAFIDLKDSTLMFVPCIERETKSNERFLKQSPLDILKNGNFPKLPTLIGFSNMEGLFRSPLYSAWKDEMNSNFSAFLPADMEFGNVEQINVIAQRIKKFYFDTEPVEDETIQNYVNYFTDAMFAYPALRTVKLMREAGNDNVFLYEYSYVDGLLPSSPPPFNKLRGASHCGETSALLEMPSLGLDGSGDSADNKKMKTLMRKLWISFIKTGKPIADETSAFPKGWPAVSSNGAPYMELNYVSELNESGLLAERFAFWENLYERHYRQPIPPIGA